MKNKLFSLAIILMFNGIAVGQNYYEILERQLPLNKDATSFSANVIGVNEDFLIYNWQKFIEKHNGITYLISRGEGNLEFESEHVILPFMENQIVTLHSRISPNNTETGVLLTIWIMLPNGKYYSSRTDNASAAKIKEWMLEYNLQLMAENDVFRE